MTENTKKTTPKKAPTKKTTAPAMNPPADVFADKVFCKEMKARMNSITKEFNKATASFVHIAFDLHYIHSNKGYQVLGAKDIYTLAKEKFDISRGTTNGYINVVERFAKRDESGVVLPELEDKYKAFSCSQLIVLLGMDDDTLALADAKMSVRELKKLGKPALATTADSGDSESDESEIKAKEVEVPNRQNLITLHSEEDYNRNIDNIDTIILRAFRAKGEDGKPKKYKVEISMVW